MRSIFFEELNLITIIPCIFFRLINYKIYYFKISKLLQNLRLIILLKKININWVNYQDYKINFGVNKKFLNYLDIASEISENFTNKFWHGILSQIFQKKEYLKLTIEFNVKKDVLESIELIELINFLKKEKKEKIKFIFAKKSKINSLVFMKFKVKNNNFINLQYFTFIYKTIFHFLKTFTLFLKFKKKEKFLDDHQGSHKTNDEFKVIFFPHDICTSGLYKKDFFYLNDSKKILFPKNILHVEWSDNYINQYNKEYYRNNKIKYILWKDCYNKESLKTSCKTFLTNIFFFQKIFFYDLNLFFLILTSDIKMNKIEKIFNEYKNLKFLLSGHYDLFSPELLVVCRKRKIISLAYDDRPILSSYSSRVMFDYFFVSGNFTKRNMEKKQYQNLNCNFIDAYMLKSEKIKKKEIKKNLKCLILDLHSNEDWYLNNLNPVNNYRLNKQFYELVMSLAVKFSDISFYIKSKDYNWLKIDYYKDLITSLKSKSNILILEDEIKWKPETAASEVDFAFGNHSSLIDEIFASRKPILIYDTFSYPTKFMNYGDYITCYNTHEVFDKFEKIKNNLDNYNNMQDKSRENFYFKSDPIQYKKKIEDIISAYER